MGDQRQRDLVVADHDVRVVLLLLGEIGDAVDELHLGHGRAGDREGIGHELEPERRGVYGGAVGYLNHDGDLDTCIAIRTMVERGGSVEIQAGAGIVHDSVPESELAECANKARALVEAEAMAESLAEDVDDSPDPEGGVA